MTLRRTVVAVLGVSVGVYVVLFLLVLDAPGEGRFAPAVGVHLGMMVLAFIAIALAVKDIQSNATLDEQARSRWSVGMAAALPLVAIAYLVMCSRRDA